MTTRPLSRMHDPHSPTGALRQAEVLQQAEARLQSSGYPALKELTCHFHEGVLVLHGSLPSFYLKQVAQTLMMGIEGVMEVLNRTEVTGKTED